ncbi:MAG TPA: hypothetical protein VE690_07625 [Rhodopila sp.]|nr:hypothetical protein [Rhodopila sp.]
MFHLKVALAAVAVGIGLGVCAAGITRMSAAPAVAEPSAATYYVLEGYFNLYDPPRARLQKPVVVSMAMPRN